MEKVFPEAQEEALTIRFCRTEGPGDSGDILSHTLPHLRCWRTIPMGRLSLYLVGIYGVAAAYLVYLNRRGPVTRNGRIPVTKAAEMLREAWADHHTTA
jgi:hypothetical protein